MLSVPKRNSSEDSEPTDSSTSSKKAKTEESMETGNGNNSSSEGKFFGSTKKEETNHLSKSMTVNNPMARRRWQLHLNDVKARLAYLRKSGDFSDCLMILKYGETTESIKAHRTVLCMSSPKFEEMLMENKQDGQIEIEGVEPRIFNMLLDYMYLDKVELSNTEDATHMYRVALRFSIPHLCELSAHHMVKDMNFDSLWSVLQVAAETQEPVLKEECAKFVRKHPLLVLQHQNFSKVDRNIVMMVVELDCLDVPESEILTSVEKWAMQQCVITGLPVNRENKRALLGSDILHKLRFLAVSQEEFVKSGMAYQGNEEKGLLTLEESYALLMNMAVLNSYPMPSGFSSDTRPRKLAKLRCIRRLQPGFPHQGFGTPPPAGAFPSNIAADRVVALASPSQMANLGGKNFSLDIKVDHPIVLYGIQVPSLWFPLGSAPAAKGMAKEYDESFIVTVLDPSGTPISHTVYASKVPYGSVVDISLKESIILQRNIQYKVQVYTSNTYFLSKRLSCVEDIPPVKFTFKDTAKIGTATSGYTFGSASNMKQETDCGFITQLIYSVWS